MHFVNLCTTTCKLLASRLAMASPAFCTYAARAPLKRAKHAHCANRPRWRCTEDTPTPAPPIKIVEPHPYGNGGLVNEAIMDGYDPETSMAAYAEHKRAFEEYNANRKPPRNRWAVVVNADAIQWRNNLFELAQEGFGHYRLAELGIAEISEGAALEMFASCAPSAQFFSVIRISAEEVLTITPSSHPDLRVLLAFENEGDAERLHGYLRAENYAAEVVRENVGLIRDMCERRDAVIGIVPSSTLISSAQVGA